MKRTQILLTEELYDRLAALSQRTDASLSALVRNAVYKIYLPEKKKGELPAFGLWKNRKETDKALLKKLGGNWKNFPLDK